MITTFNPNIRYSDADISRFRQTYFGNNSLNVTFIINIPINMPIFNVGNPEITINAPYEMRQPTMEQTIERNHAEFHQQFNRHNNHASMLNGYNTVDETLINQLTTLPFSGYYPTVRTIIGTPTITLPTISMLYEPVTVYFDSMDRTAFIDMQQIGRANRQGRVNGRGQHEIWTVTANSYHPHSPSIINHTDYCKPCDMETIDKLISNDATCSICLEQFEKNNDCVITNNCNHIFHKKCLESWLPQNVTCPMCRTDMRAVIDSDDEEKLPELNDV